MVERVKSRRAFSASSRSKFIKKDKEGVASTVGTIMALLVFLTFLTMFTNTYIPIWMKENEKNHMDVVLNQFGDLKGKVDSLVVNAQVTGRPTINMYQPITLGSDGVPVFATATAGYLWVKSVGTYDSRVSLSFNYSLGATDIPYTGDIGGGCVEFYGPNRYYVQQWYCYENGALLIYQQDGMAMRATPTLDFVKNTDSISVFFDEVDVLGRNNTIGGTGSAGLALDLIVHDTQSYTVNGNVPFVMTFTTRYNTTWINYLEESLKAEGLVEGVGNDYTLEWATVPSNEYRQIYTITLTLNDVYQFVHGRSYVAIDLEY